MANPAATPLLIIPPPQRRVIVDKTAKFVAMKGRAIEEEILSKPQAKNAASFTFILEDDPYHQYYLSKIQFFTDNPNAPLDVAPAAPVPAAAANATANATANAPAAAASPAATPLVVQAEEGGGRNSVLNAAVKAASKKKSVDPPPFEFLTQRPLDANIPKIELIKLTAQFTATDGKKFETDLYHTQGQNPDFDFLDAQHEHHLFYLEMIKAYRLILEGKVQWVVNELAANESVILERAVHRLEHKRQEDLKNMETEEKKLAERAAFLEIDWHDFVVVETIRFDAPAQEQQQQYNDAFNNNFGPSIAPPRIPPDQLAADAVRRAVLDDSQDDELLGEVRKDYRVEPVRATREQLMVTLPDGRRVPASEMNQHVKVELRDPKWREQQEKFEARQRDTNLVDSGSVSQNLVRMAWARPDVFGGEMEDAERKMEEKKRKEAERIIWDGNALTADSVKSVIAAAQSSTNAVGGGAYNSVVSSFVNSLAPPPLPVMPSAPSSFIPPVVQPPPLPGMGTQTNPNEQEEPTTTAKRMKLSENEPSSGGQSVYKVLVPGGGPIAFAFDSITVGADDTNSVEQFKQLISNQLKQIPVGKFQLKTGNRFLKNTDLMNTVDDFQVEIKWKTR